MCPWWCYPESCVAVLVKSEAWQRLASDEDLAWARKSDTDGCLNQDGHNSGWCSASLGRRCVTSSVGRVAVKLCYGTCSKIWVKPCWGLTCVDDWVTRWFVTSTDSDLAHEALLSRWNFQWLCKQGGRLNTVWVALTSWPCTAWQISVAWAGFEVSWSGIKGKHPSFAVIFAAAGLVAGDRLSIVGLFGDFVGDSFMASEALSHVFFWHMGKCILL